MKPSKTTYPSYTTTTKKRPAKRRDGGNPMVDKLLKLKYRINDIAKQEDGWSDDMSSDKEYVQGQINKLRGGGNLYKLHMEECNKIWKRYA